jgi:hypothetical protein
MDLNNSSGIGTWRHLAAKVGTSKGRGKQWQTTPKNLPRMQRARAMLVAWLGSGSFQNWSKGWMLMMMSGTDDSEEDTIET